MNDSSIDGAREELSGIIKIIGIGQSLRGDDGCWAGRGPFLARTSSWLIENDADIQVELAELPGFELLNLLEGSQPRYTGRCGT